MSRLPVVLFVLLLAGCGLRQPVTEPATYLLDTAGEPARVAQSTGDVLLVTPPRAEPGFDGTGIVYTEIPLQLNVYTESQWADAPARMLAPLLVQTLERTGAFRAVVTLPSSVVADYQLDVVLLRLVQDFLQRPSRVRLALRASLIDTAANRVLANRLFETEQTAPSDDAYGGVQAANRALARLLTEIAEFVVEEVSSTDSPNPRSRAQ